MTVTPQDRNQIQRNWDLVREAVAEAIARSNRLPESVRIVGVTKYVDAETAVALAQAGCMELGENRPQLLWQKADAISSSDPEMDIRWHLIGHLQTNKISRTLAYRPLIHSVDSLRLIQAIEDAVAKHATIQSIDVLLEVNISGDANKTGLSLPSLEGLLTNSTWPHVQVCGLMAMSGLGVSPDEARRQFAAVREYRDALEQRFQIQLPELSMGMSDDFVPAIEEGATLVRIGSKLFQGISHNSH